MKTILLTGGSGFIGKNILESPLALRYRIVAPSSAELNLVDTQSVDAFFAKQQRFDCVVHSGARPGHRNAGDTSQLLYSNLRMFENLARHSGRYDRFLNIGSGAVYDVGGQISNVCEHADLFARIPADEHGFCKYTVARRIEQLPGFVDLIVFGVFGRYEDAQIRFISNAICKAVLGLPITLRQSRRFSYIDVADLMPVLEFFIENEPAHSFYNVVGNEPVELEAIAAMVREISGASIEVQIAAEGLGKDYYGCNSRLREQIADIRFTPLRTSVERLYRYYSERKQMLDPRLFHTDK